MANKNSKRRNESIREHGKANGFATHGFKAKRFPFPEGHARTWTGYKHQSEAGAVRR